MKKGFWCQYASVNMRSDAKNRVDVEMDLMIWNRASKIVSLGTIGVSLKIVKTRFFSKTNEKGFWCQYAAVNMRSDAKTELT